jgi:hypothetical protein
MAKQDLDAPQRQPRPDWSYWDRPSARTDAEREASFQRYLEISQPYMDKIAADGDVPWHGGDIEARRRKFSQRYIRPAPPAGLPPVDLAVIRGGTARWSPIPTMKEKAA